MNENRKMLILLGAMSMVAILGFTYFALKIGALDVSNQQEFKLHFTSAIGIPDNADVRIYGIKVGNVKRMGLAEKPGAYVWIGVQPDIKVYSDARAVVKAKSLLGERFIELQPGSGPAILQSGSAITDTLTPVRLEDLGEVFGPLVSNVDAEQIQLAFKTLMDVIVENREAIRQGGKAFATALTRMSDMIDDEEDIVRLKSFLDSLTDLTIRLNKLTGANEDVLMQTFQDMGATMKDFREITTEVKKLSKDFPEYASDLGTMLKMTSKMMKQLEEFDSKRAGLILKKILQQEGLTFSVRGYSMNELEAHMAEYEKIMQEGPDAIKTECTPALIETGNCKPEPKK